MKEEIDLVNLELDSSARQQIHECCNLVRSVLGRDLLGAYLYGSSTLGGLQRYSDIDLFIVSDRATTREEKAKLAAALLEISGIYMKSKKLPIEMTIVEKAEVNPWHYPPRFDFQYGDWLRKAFECGNVELWSTKAMPDLALLITQVFLASTTLMGAHPDQLLCSIPYKDVMIAMRDAFPDLMQNLESDTRNVLLTLARIWSTVATGAIRSKRAAADWAIDRLPEGCRLVMGRAREIYKGEAEEYWEDVEEHIKPCADFMLSEASYRIDEVMLCGDLNRSIKID